MGNTSYNSCLHGSLATPDLTRARPNFALVKHFRAIFYQHNSSHKQQTLA